MSLGLRAHSNASLRWHGSADANDLLAASRAIVRMVRLARWCSLITCLQWSCVRKGHERRAQLCVHRHQLQSDCVLPGAGKTLECWEAADRPTRKDQAWKA